MIQLTNRELARFEKFFWKGNEAECWNWLGAISHGYGNFRLGVKAYRAHRISYLVEYGPFDSSLYVLHKCDNPLCVNPHHLFLGDHQENMDDMVAKGRQEQGQRHHAVTLLDSEVKQILNLQGKCKQVDLSMRFNVSEATISRLINGKRKVQL